MKLAVVSYSQVAIEVDTTLVTKLMRASDKAAIQSPIPCHLHRPGILLPRFDAKECVPGRAGIHILSNGDRYQLALGLAETIRALGNDMFGNLSAAAVYKFIADVDAHSQRHGQARAMSGC